MAITKVKSVFIHLMIDYLKENAVGLKNGKTFKQIKAHMDPIAGINFTQGDISEFALTIRKKKLIRYLLASKARGYYISSDKNEVENYLMIQQKTIWRIEEHIDLFTEYDELLDSGEKKVEINDDDIDDF